MPSSSGASSAKQAAFTAALARKGSTAGSHPTSGDGGDDQQEQQHASLLLLVTRRRNTGMAPHEERLLALGWLRDITHPKATSTWLSAESIGAHFDEARSAVVLPPRMSLDVLRTEAKQLQQGPSWVDFVDDFNRRARSSSSAPSNEVAADAAQAGLPLVAVYRPMADTELSALLSTGQLPATQPYHAIMPGEAGRGYSVKYLTGAKRVDTGPTTVVEFVLPQLLLDALMARQCKAEDGTMSHGLGDRAGRTVGVFNTWLAHAERCSAGWHGLDGGSSSSCCCSPWAAALATAAAKTSSAASGAGGENDGTTAAGGFGAHRRPATAAFRVVHVKCPKPGSKGRSS